MAPRWLFVSTLFVLLSGSALFFAGSVAAPQILARTGASDVAAGVMTVAVQLGFVAGTLATVALDLPDRVAARRLLSGLLLVGAAANAMLLTADNVWTAVAWRFLAGASAGPIYPIGMRLLATWYTSLGPRLGILLAAYTFGAGVAAMLRVARVPFEGAILGATALALVAACMAWTIRSGPILAIRARFDPRALARAYAVPAYRWSSLGYFGHMWELFAFWGLVPFWLAATGIDGAWRWGALAGIYAAGALGCLWAAYASRRIGNGMAAHVALIGSGLLCLLSPWVFTGPTWLVFGAVVAWGFLVIADSPMFSAISAQAAPRQYVGSALTIQNSIGFAVPILPLLAVPALVPWVSWRWAFLLLAAGPLWGVWFTRRLVGAKDLRGHIPSGAEKQ